MSSVNFSHFDPVRVKKFMYHLLETQRDGSPVSRPDKETRHVGDIYKKAIETKAPKELITRINTLEKKFDSFQSKVDRIVQHIDKLDTQEKQLEKREDKEEIDVEALKQKVEALEASYAKLKRLKVPPADLKRVRKRIDSIKRKIPKGK